MKGKHSMNKTRRAATGTSRSLIVRSRSLLSRSGRELKESHASREGLWLLVAWNVCNIALAVYQRWPLAEVALLTWSQNIVIGVFTCMRLLSWPKVLGDDGVVLTKNEKTFSVFVLAVPFFGLHALLFVSYGGLAPSFSAIRIPLGMFVIIQYVSFVLNYGRDTDTPKRYSQIFSIAFILVLPFFLSISILLPIVVVYMTLATIAYLAGVNEATGILVTSTIEGWFPSVFLIVFMGLKAFFDIAAQIESHSSAPAVGSR